MLPVCFRHRIQLHLSLSTSPIDAFLNGSDGSGGFTTTNSFFPNNYLDDPQFPSWSGWSISTKTDTLSAGFTNQYSAIPGSGVDGSSTYAVSFVSSGSKIHLTDDAAGGSLAGLYVTNNTYAYLSMLDGDTFTKRFGGETGDDPDFLLLSIKKYLNGELSTDSVDFYLADYRFADNSQDYIVKDWNFIDLSSLGDVDSLRFSITGSDTGQFGLNTPAYVCVDNIITLNRTTAAQDHNPALSVRIFPNPTIDQVTVRWNEDTNGQLRLFNANGQALRQSALVYGNNTVDMNDLPRGSYFLRLETEGGWMSKQLIKQ